MALSSTQPVTEMSAGYIFWGVEAAGVRVDNITTFICRLSRKLGGLKFLELSGSVKTSTRIDFY